jgi:hypothetical protein
MSSRQRRSRALARALKADPALGLSPIRSPRTPTGPTPGHTVADPAPNLRSAPDRPHRIPPPQGARPWNS